MKKLSLKSLIAVASLAASGVAFAQSANFTASRTFEFDPDKTGGAVANWVKGIGLPDGNGNGNTNFGLDLEKNVPLDANVSAGAVLNGLKGVVVLAGDTMGYDMTNSSPRQAGSPRFNVSWTLNGVSGFSFVGGSSNATQTPACQAPSTWTRFRMNLQDPGQAFPIVPVGAVLQSVVLIVDDPGKYTLDNINFRDQIATKQGSSSTTTGCP
jgi:hypothetical protein